MFRKVRIVDTIEESDTLIAPLDVEEFLNCYLNVQPDAFNLNKMEIKRRILYNYGGILIELP